MMIRGVCPFLPRCMCVCVMLRLLHVKIYTYMHAVVLHLHVCEATDTASRQQVKEYNCTESVKIHKENRQQSIFPAQDENEIKKI